MALAPASSICFANSTHPARVRPFRLAMIGTSFCFDAWRSVWSRSFRILLSAMTSSSKTDAMTTAAAPASRIWLMPSILRVSGEHEATTGCFRSSPR